MYKTDVSGATAHTLEHGLAVQQTWIDSNPGLAIKCETHEPDPGLFNNQMFIGH